MSICLPALGFVFLHYLTKSLHEPALKYAIISRCVVGRALFGFLADDFERRKVYSFAIVVLMLDTMGAAISSTGHIILDHTDGGNRGSIDSKSVGSMDIHMCFLF